MSVLALQERLAYEVGGRIDRLGSILLYETPPVITIGREGSHAQLRVEPDELTARMIDVHWLSRGGSNQVHLPGQLCACIVVPIERLGLGLVAYRSCLEQALSQTCAELKVKAKTQEARVIARTGQIGAVGVMVKSGVTQFGLSLNVQPNLELVRMCDTGGAELRHSSLSADRMKHTSMSRVRECLVRYLMENLGYETRHWYTGHPLLTRTKKKVYVHS